VSGPEESIDSKQGTVLVWARVVSHLFSTMSHRLHRRSCGDMYAILDKLFSAKPQVAGLTAHWYCRIDWLNDKSVHAILDHLRSFRSPWQVMYMWFFVDECL